MGAHALKHIDQISVGIHAVQPAGADQALDDADVFGADLGSAKQLVFVARSPDYHDGYFGTSVFHKWDEHAYLREFRVVLDECSTSQQSSRRFWIDGGLRDIVHDCPARPLVARGNTQTVAMSVACRVWAWAWADSGASTLSHMCIAKRAFTCFDAGLAAAPLRGVWLGRLNPLTSVAFRA